jgi:hypothetical protein
MVTQVEIAKRVGLDVSSVNKILNRTPGPVFRKDTVQKVLRIAREMGYDFNRIKHRHRRKHTRRDVSTGTRVSIYRRDGTLYDEGTGVINDIGSAGASVSNLKLSRGSLPAEPFGMMLRPQRGPLKFQELRGRVARILVRDELVLGLTFENVDPRTLVKLEKLTTG